jgi:lysophospholipase L1-like esterase
MSILQLHWKKLFLSLFVCCALGLESATQSVPPWESPAALTPIRMRKPWIPCYRADQNRPDIELQIHNHLVQAVESQQPDVMFVGDSLMSFWRRPGNIESWKKQIDPLNAYNLGVPGDMTENILWRLSNGELYRVKPKVIVLLTGTNNLWRDTPEDITKGVVAITDLIAKATPNAKVLLLGVLPRADREARPDFPDKIDKLNKSLSHLADGKRISYFYFGDKYLDQEGHLAKGFLADGLHPTAKGYQVWADQIRPVLDDLLK